MKLLNSLERRLRNIEFAVFGNGDNTKSEMTITPATAKNGTLTAAQLKALTDDVGVCIKKGSDYFILAEDKRDMGYLVYGHSDGAHMCYIYVTISTRGWVLQEG